MNIRLKEGIQAVSFGTSGSCFKTYMCRKVLLEDAIPINVFSDQGHADRKDDIAVF
jgi:hypothetical protein